MRVIAGSAKGRKLTAPPGLATRPMMSRAREALFSSIGPLIPGARVLDLYAGSGSLGIEALSRGAASVTFVEQSGAARKFLVANLERTGFTGTVIAGDATRALANIDGPFDLVFVDPPFDMESAPLVQLVQELAAATAPGATVVLHRRVGDEAVAAPAPFEEIAVRTYGDSALWRYARTP